MGEEGALLIMETRTITEVRLYLLVLNTFRGVEESDVVAISTDYDKLVSWYKEQFAEEPYRENGFYKVFRKGSLIENNNPCNSLVLNETSLYGHGIRDKWVMYDDLDKIKRYYNFI